MRRVKNKIRKDRRVERGRCQGFDRPRTKAKFIVLPEAAHSINWEQPEALNRNVLEFIGKHWPKAGSANGNLYAMKTSIDHAGRLVIPKDIRRESGIKPGMALDVRWENGKIAITPASIAVNLERKGRLVVAVPTKAVAPLSTNTIERIRKKLRRERSADCT